MRLFSNQVAKHPLSTPGPAGVYTPPPSRHATLPGAAQVRLNDFDQNVFQGVLAGITMTGSLPYNFPANMTPNMGARDISSLGWLFLIPNFIPLECLRSIFWLPNPKAWDGGLGLGHLLLHGQVDPHLSLQ